MSPPDPSRPPAQPGAGRVAPHLYGTPTGAQPSAPPYPAGAQPSAPPYPAGAQPSAPPYPATGPFPPSPATYGGGVYPTSPATFPASAPPARVPPASAAPRRAGIAVGASLIALLLALTATALSIYAIGIANGAKTTSTAAASTGGGNAGGGTTGGGATSAPGPAITAPVQTAAPAPRASAGELDPKAAFTEAYSPTTQTLQIHPASAYNRNIDLDKPQVGGTNDQADISLNTNGQDEAFRFGDGTAVAEANSPDVQPGDCVDLIRTSALPTDSLVPAGTANLTLCISTSFAEAKTQGISWKMVVLHVTAVANDGTVQVELKAWNIPD